MEEFPRSSCLYHPGEIITNFCTDKSCLMPLCPTCICSHSNTHPNQRPSFAHINDTLSFCHGEIQELLLTLEGSRMKVDLINRKMAEEKQSWTDLMNKTRTHVIEMVDAYFEELRKEIEAGADKQNRILGLHVADRIKAVERKINEHTDQLVELKNDLFNDRCLSTVITFYHETKGVIDKSHCEIQREVKDNQTYSPILVVQPDAFQKLKHSLSQFFVLNFGGHPSKSTRVSAGETPARAQSPIRGQSSMSSAQTSRVVVGLPFLNITNEMNNIHPSQTVSHHQFASTLPNLPSPRMSLNTGQVPKLNRMSSTALQLREEKSPRSPPGIKLVAPKSLQESRSREFLSGLRRQKGES